LNDVAGYALKDGRRFGALNVKSINAAAVDRLYEKLRIMDGVLPKSQCIDSRNDK
jgi:hypothetical protein